VIEVVAANAITNGSERIDLSSLEAEDLVLPLVSMTRGMHRSLSRRAA
jgi:hypothetical protein